MPVLSIIAAFVLSLGSFPWLASLPDEPPNQVAPQSVEQPVLERMRQRARGAVRYQTRRGTDAVSFLRVAPGGDLLPDADAATPAAKARQFFQAYGELFGLQDADAELLLTDTALDAYGTTHLTYRQIYQRVPVFGGELRAHVDAQGRLTTVNGVTAPDVRVDVTPTLNAAEAGAIGVAAVAAGLDGNGAVDLAAVAHRLYVFRDGLLAGVVGRVHLVYEVEVANPEGTVREFVYVDAHDGGVVNQITGTQGLDREVSERLLRNVVWDESAGDPDPIPAGWAGGSADQVAAWTDEIDGARETYNLFGSLTNGAWLSYDGLGATMRTVNNVVLVCPNAFWNGRATNYCSGVTADDVVAHEWGHAYTEYTSGLIYQYQSGALNESYSDIWGETVDLLNSRGLDAHETLRTDGACSVHGGGANPVDDTYRWLLGEDATAFNGAIRDMWNPTCYGDPGRVSEFPLYRCPSGDSGGVHINSGVPNHLYALLVDGGAYNGVTVDDIGLTRAAHIHWQAQRFYLTPASNFVDHADALTAACTDLIDQPLYALSTGGPDDWGTISSDVIAPADCDSLARAIQAVELRTDPWCPIFPRPRQNGGTNSPTPAPSGNLDDQIFLPVVR